MLTRRISASLRVDFTPFVSVALLLIVFFVWAKMVQRLNVMALAVPDKINCEYVQIDGWSTILTIYLIGDHNVLYAFGEPGQQSNLTMAHLQGKAMRGTLLHLSKKLKDRVVIVIKPTDESTYADIVDMLDEMHLVKFKRYALVDALTPAERSSVTQFLHSPPIKDTLQAAADKTAHKRQDHGTV
ncbi:biopolymer transporter ExbD [Spirosoma aerolatum]|uniref:biopolymer transporter ExbD n=1 Tax=Spirosoma aerolatum TaxID=1211326 RepID=UPI0009ABDEB2|nr:biopolymer transporter ExbD [Spirosoma aerolatum]